MVYYIIILLDTIEKPKTTLTDLDIIDKIIEPLMEESEQEYSPLRAPPQGEENAIRAVEQYEEEVNNTEEITQNFDIIRPVTKRDLDILFTIEIRETVIKGMITIINRLLGDILNVDNLANQLQKIKHLNAVINSYGPIIADYIPAPLQSLILMSIKIGEEYTLQTLDQN